MLYSFGILIICFIYLYFLNYILIKNNFCLDTILIHEKHKILLQLNQKTPLSGSIYFIPIFFLLIFFQDQYFFLACLLFLCIGLLSDLKIMDSPSLRLFFQFIIVFLFLFLNQDLNIDTRIGFLNELINHEYLRLITITFFFLVLINGYNFIDGVNTLASLNFLIVLIFLYFLSNDFGFIEYKNLIKFLILPLIIFIFFNFFGKNFLGDGAVYGLSFFIAVIIIEISMLNEKISPYFIANLLLYPAFENLFSIIRRVSLNKKNYLADNNHLHQLLFKFLKNKNIINKKFLLSSLTGIIINLYFSIIYFIGYLNYSDTKHQIFLIVFNILSYLTIYFFLRNKSND